MKVKVKCGQIQEAVRLAEKISGKNLTLPVLGCIFLSAENNLLSLKATNLDIGVEISIPSEVEVKGVVAVPSAVLLHTLLAKDSSAELSLATQSENLLVKSSGGEATIKAHPHADFPTIPRPGNAKNFYLPTTTLLTGLKSVWYSSAVSALKPELSSIYISPYDKNLYFVATDSFRLAEKRVPLKGTVPDFEPVLLPFKNTAECIRLLEGLEGDVQISLTQSQISFTHEHVYLTSRLVDGSFPDYKQIIPTETHAEAVVLKEDFLRVLKNAGVFADAFNQIRFALDPAKKTFKVSSKNSEVGETVERVEGSLSGSLIDVGFNHKYIMDVFQSLSSDSISLTFGGLSRPMVIRGLSDNSFLYLVMPMNK